MCQNRVPIATFGDKRTRTLKSTLLERVYHIYIYIYTVRKVAKGINGNIKMSVIYELSVFLESNNE